MAAFVLSFILLLALTGYSSGANYCVCKDGVGDQVLQKNIDYACGNGADCTGILQNGPCYNPNTIKDHCSYAVNSYYQRKVASGATCDFSGTATLTSSPPSSSSSSCYQATGGTTGGITTPTTPGTTTNPGIGTGTGTGTGTSTGTGTGTSTGTNTGINNPTFGLGPTGSGYNPDGSGTETLHLSSAFFTIALLFTSSLLVVRLRV